jgi:hypothetical protein
MISFLLGTEAITTVLLAFSRSGLHHSSRRTGSSKAFHRNVAPAGSRMTALWGTDIMFRFFPGTEAVTTLLRAFPFAGISDLRMRVVPRELGGPRGAPTTNTRSNIGHTIVQPSGEKQCSGKEKDGCKRNLVYRFHTE